MPTFEEILQNYVNLDYDSLVNIAKQSANNLLPVCALVDKDNKGVMLLSCVILAGIGADGKLSAKEYQFLSDVLGLNDETIDGFIKMYDAQMVDVVDNFADNLNVSTKADTVTLLTAVAACDETISREETALLRKILE